MRTFGSDPELLLMKDGKPCSAIDIIKYDSVNRLTINGHQFYRDNVLAECAIAPGDSRSEVISNFKDCLSLYAKNIEPHKFSIQASILFPDDELKNPKAKEVGCDPDWCAYRIELMHPPIEAIKNSNLRSCGGHIHLGSDLLASDGPEPILVVYMLDLFLGIPSLWLEQDDTSARRRLIYGHAGRYRPKDYGLEYRSLSSFWLQSPKLVGLIYDLSMFVQDFVEDGRAWEMWEFDEDVFFESENLAKAWKCVAYDPHVIQSAINGSDKLLAEPLLAIARQYLPHKLWSDLENLINRQDNENLYESWDL